MLVGGLSGSELVVTADGGDGAVEIDAVDVAVTSVDDDVEEVARRRSKVVLDALLLTAEAAWGTFADRANNWLTPEEKEEWKQGWISLF